MAEIIKVYEEEVPGSRFIGKQYGDKDRVHHNFGHLWHEWFDRKYFATLEGLVDEGWAASFPEAGSYIGLMRFGEGKDFEYWIGMFLPAGTVVPEGYTYLDVPALRQGVCWVQGMEPEIFWQVDAALDAMYAQDTPPAQDSESYLWVMERYQHPRFTQPDEAGNKILDMVVMTAILSETEEDVANLRYCGHCYHAFSGEACPDCSRKGAQLHPDDPIFIGELPGRLRNALQIGFGATEIPFNALSNLGSGFTLSAGELFERYKIYVPYHRAREAKATFDQVIAFNQPEA